MILEIQLTLGAGVLKCSREHYRANTFGVSQCSPGSNAQGQPQKCRRHCQSPLGRGKRRWPTLARGDAAAHGGEPRLSKERARELKWGKTIRLLRHQGCATEPLMDCQYFSAINSQLPLTVHGKSSTSRSLFSEPSLTQALLVPSSCLARYNFFLPVLSYTIQQSLLSKTSPCCIFLLGSRSLYSFKTKLFLPAGEEHLCDCWRVFFKPSRSTWRSFKWP